MLGLNILLLQSRVIFDSSLTRFSIGTSFLNPLQSSFNATIDHLQKREKKSSREHSHDFF